MHKTFKLLLSFLIMTSIASCAGKKTEGTAEEQTIDKECSPMDLYFMRPLAMLVSPGGGDNNTAYLPDFINYPNDLMKLGLRGQVKECVAGISTIKYTYKFNPDGNLTNYQFRMDSQGTFGEGSRLEYDGEGKLTLLGRDFRGQSTNSHTYSYAGGKLSRRTYGNGYREYIWEKLSDGTMIPQSVVTHGLKPMIDISYTRNSDGDVVLSEMSYQNPSMPGNRTAKAGTSTFEYQHDGRIAKVLTTYQGCSDPKYKEMYGVCKYTYNEHGDVDSKVMELYDSSSDNKQKLYTETLNYKYSYDHNGNWVSVNVDGSPSQSGSISYMNRTITYYTEDELAELQRKKKALQEKPLIGQWRYTNKHIEEYEDGDRETIEETGTLVLNIYDKFIPDGYTDPQFGVLFVQSEPSMGMEQYGSWTIIDAKTHGDDIIIKLQGFNSGDVYSASLSYDPTSNSVTLKNLKLSKKAPADNSEYGSDFETFDLEPFEGEYKFLKRSTTNN